MVPEKYIGASAMHPKITFVIWQCKHSFFVIWNLEVVWSFGNKRINILIMISKFPSKPLLTFLSHFLLVWCRPTDRNDLNGKVISHFDDINLNPWSSFYVPPVWCPTFCTSFCQIQQATPLIQIAADRGRMTFPFEKSDEADENCNCCTQWSPYKENAATTNANPERVGRLSDYTPLSFL